MELLQKFAAVEIQANHRITKTDKDYCEQHQKAYEAAITNFQELAFFCADMAAAQDGFHGIGLNFHQAPPPKPYFLRAIR